MIKKKKLKMEKNLHMDKNWIYQVKKNDLNQMKNISGEIVDLVLNLLDLLDKEKVLKQNREDAIKYLDNISKDYDASKDEEIEKKITGILNIQELTLEQLDSHVNELKQKEVELTQ